MKLDLDRLFNLFEEIEKEDLLQEKLSIGAETVLKLIIPKIDITGKSIGNQEILNKFIEGVPGTSIGEKLNQLSILTTKFGKVDKRGKNLSLLTEKIAILDALTRLFNEFEASPAGFLNETFVSAFFPGGFKIPAGSANSENIVTDVRGDKEYSIKTITPGTKIGGSVYNLCNTIYHYGEVVYLIFEKGSVGKGEEKKITSFTMYEYSITKDNLSSILLDEKEGNRTAADYYAQYQHIFSKDNSKEKLEEEMPQIPTDKLTQKKDASSEKKSVKSNPKQKKEKIPKLNFIIDSALYKSSDPVVVNFSTDQALEELSLAIGDAIVKIKTLHQDMQILTESLSKYFVSQKEQEKVEIANKMINASENVEPKTKEVLDQK